MDSIDEQDITSHLSYVSQTITQVLIPSTDVLILSTHPLQHLMGVSTGNLNVSSADARSSDAMEVSYLKIL